MKQDGVTPKMMLGTANAVQGSRLANDGAQALVSQMQRHTKTSRVFVVQVPLMGNSTCCHSEAEHKLTVSALNIC